MKKPIQYAGKTVIIGKDTNGKAFLAYRATSRSASDRFLEEVTKKEGEQTEGRQVRIFPGSFESHAGTEKDLMWLEPYFDPYVCLRVVKSRNGTNVFASNGNQTNRVHSLMYRGLDLKSAIIQTSINYDYERSSVARVYAGLKIPTEDEVKFFGNPEGYIGILGVNNPLDFRVKVYRLEAGKLRLVGSTKEAWDLETTVDFDVGFNSAQELARFLSISKDVKSMVLDLGKEKEELFAYVSAALQLDKNEFDIGIYNEFDEVLEKSLGGLEQEELEKRLRPGGASDAGFLGKDERYVGVLREDWFALKRLGISYAAVANAIKKMNHSEGVTIPEKTINNDYFAFTEVCCGSQYCPWGDGVSSDSYTIVGNKNNPEHRAFVGYWRQRGGILPEKREFDAMFTSEPVLIIPWFQDHLIEQHNFFQGKGTIYRTEPALLAKYLGLK